MLDAASQHRGELAAHMGFVRLTLIRFGASGGDLDDLAQEVWLVALSRRPTFTDDRGTRAWLHQVCRRVAAGERRSRSRRPQPSESVETELLSAPEQLDSLQRELDEQETLAALARLSEEQLDVLTLYGSGELSMREVAELVGEPEQTVYSRYRNAIDEVTRDLRRSATLGPRPSSFPPPRVLSTPPSAPPDRESAADQGELTLYRRDRDLAMGRLGNVIVADWRRRFFETSAADVAEAIKFAHTRLQVPIVLINTGAPDLVLPHAQERGTLRYYIHETAPQTVISVDISDNLPVARLLTTIVNGIMLITRADRRSSFAMVPSVEAARSWVAPHARSVLGPLAWERIVRAIQSVRLQGLAAQPAPATYAAV
jgi:RNA polymerase sigma-70 factor (ECF subfamily)